MFLKKFMIMVLNFFPNGSSVSGQSPRVCRLYIPYLYRACHSFVYLTFKVTSDKLFGASGDEEPWKQCVFHILRACFFSGIAWTQQM